MFKCKKKAIKFVGRKQSGQGLVSTIIGIVSVITFGVMVYLATKEAGKMSIIVGLAGLILLLLTLAGLITGVKGLKQKDIFYTLPIVGIVINGIMFIGMVVLYFLGLSSMAT